MVTSIRSAVRATAVASAQQKRTETNTEDDEDDELVDKRDDDDDDDNDDEVRHQIQLDVDVVKRRRGIPTTFCHCVTKARDTRPVIVGRHGRQCWPTMSVVILTLFCPPTLSAVCQGCRHRRPTLSVAKISTDWQRHPTMTCVAGIDTWTTLSPDKILSRWRPLGPTMTGRVSRL